MNTISNTLFQDLAHQHCHKHIRDIDNPRSFPPKHLVLEQECKLGVDMMPRKEKVIEGRDEMGGEWD